MKITKQKSIAIVTGGASGIGLAITEKFVSKRNSYNHYWP